MNFKTHNDKEINVNGTSFKGEIFVTFEKLLKVFGTPIGASSDGKVDVEWNIEFGNGVIATIYNWKNGPASMGEDGTNPVDITTWHIGGKNQHSVWEVEEYLKSNN
tara:strand:+ start:75798 stop:76115 length:318 start_codon:yes stop_codon:yes gene_type:complete